MFRQGVASSNIASIGYDTPSNTLEVAFHNQRVYQYFRVPQSVFIALMSAPSHGRFFNAAVKDQYLDRRIQ